MIADDRSAMPRFFPLLLSLLWLAFFGVEAGSISQAFSDAQHAGDEIDAEVSSLQESRREMSEILRQTDAYAAELEFLHGLTDILPQDKSYLRTQKVISDEVQSLRRQVGRRLNDRLHVVVDTKANKL